MAFEYQNYKMTSIYKEATKPMKKAIEDYYKTNRPGNNMMYLQLRKYELTHLPKKDMKRPSLSFSIGTLIVIVIFFVLVQMTNDTYLMMADSIVMIGFCICYFTGVFSEAKAEIRKIDKEMQKYPPIEPFKGLD